LIIKIYLQKKIKQLLNNQDLSDVTAIKNENFVVIPLSAAMVRVRISYALEILAEGIQ